MGPIVCIAAPDRPVSATPGLRRAAGTSAPTPRQPRRGPGAPARCRPGSPTTAVRRRSVTWAPRRFSAARGQPTTRSSSTSAGRSTAPKAAGAIAPPQPTVNPVARSAAHGRPGGVTLKVDAGEVDSCEVAKRPVVQRGEGGPRAGQDGAPAPSAPCKTKANLEPPTDPGPGRATGRQSGIPWVHVGAVAGAIAAIGGVIFTGVATYYSALVASDQLQQSRDDAEQPREAAE